MTGTKDEREVVSLHSEMRSTLNPIINPCYTFVIVLLILQL
uniref:Uncharacterized protein n=1 Tax=Herelleviridae sp. cttEB8 TaxID=2825832 RepID=A0A8S5P6I4_9CAUD|nr:MAG TPA: hypothetical protein [Herelleviridae sp. cttEB8]